MQILSIFLKLQAVKQSGPGFGAYPVYVRSWSYLCVIYDTLQNDYLALHYITSHYIFIIIHLFL